MTHQAERTPQLDFEDVMTVDHARFVRDVSTALSTCDLTWTDRVRARRDLEFLIVEIRGSRRPEVLDTLVVCILEILDRGGPAGSRVASTLRSTRFGDR